MAPPTKETKSSSALDQGKSISSASSAEEAMNAQRQEQNESTPSSQTNGGLPSAHLSEQMVLGILLSDYESWDELEQPLQKDYFSHPYHQTIFDAVHSLIAKGANSDELLVIEELELQGELENAGGKHYIAQLAAGAVGGMDINIYARQILDRFLRRKLLSKIGNIGRDVRGSEDTINTLLDKAEHSIFSLHDESMGVHNSRLVKDILDEALNDIEYRSKHPDELPGASTGFSKLDALTGGLQSSELVIIAGRPSMGKTSLALNIASNISINSLKPKASLIFSMEMPAMMLTIRLISMIGGVNLSRLRSGKLAKNDWHKIQQAADMLKKSPIYLDDSVNLTPMEIRARTRRVIRSLPQGVEFGVVVVDYLQLMHLKQTNENRTTEMSEISRSLKAAAKEFNCPLVALSQLNRGVEGRMNRRPMMVDLRESGAIEQDADLILFIYRDKVYNENTEEEDKAEIIVGKQRNGPTGIVHLKFDGDHSSFSSWDHPEVEYPY